MVVSFKFWLRNCRYNGFCWHTILIASTKQCTTPFPGAADQTLCLYSAVPASSIRQSLFPQTSLTSIMVGAAAPSPPAPPTQQRPLFGGAISAAVPQGFDDISVIREIPDTQEVFSHGATDRSLIFELVEQTDTTSATELPAAFHLDALAADSSASTATTHIVHQLPQSAAPRLHAEDPRLSVSIASATHTVAKFRDDAALASQVAVTMAVARLPRATTDFLIIFNQPTVLHPEGTSARGGSTVADTSEGDTIVRAALATLTIHDWGLIL